MERCATLFSPHPPYPAPPQCTPSITAPPAPPCPATPYSRPLLHLLLRSRFQPVYVLEPSPEDALSILGGLAERYERHHHCVYADEALEAAVKLSATYIADRFLPDKAIDLIDEAGSRVRIAAFNARRASQTREDPKVDEYLQVMETKDAAVRDELYEEAFLLRRRQQDYKSELSGLPAEGSSLPVVHASDVEAVVAAWSGVPVERLTEDESQKLMRLVRARVCMVCMYVHAFVGVWVRGRAWR